MWEVHFLQLWVSSLHICALKIDRRFLLQCAFLRVCGIFYICGSLVFPFVEVFTFHPSSPSYVFRAILLSKFSPNGINLFTIFDKLYMCIKISSSQLPIPGIPLSIYIMHCRTITLYIYINTSWSWISLFAYAITITISLHFVCGYIQRSLIALLVWPIH